MKNKLRILTFLCLLFSFGTNFLSAQNTAQDGSTIPEPPMQVETDAFGAQGAPIDGYVVFLAVAAIFFIVYFARNYKKQKA